MELVVEAPLEVDLVAGGLKLELLQEPFQQGKDLKTLWGF